ncbi:MAG: hypothetical protein ABI723_08910 [Bacteroidia bacterium]
MRLIGDKNKFAIEFEIKEPYGFFNSVIFIWINNQYIGDNRKFDGSLITWPISYTWRPLFLISKHLEDFYEPEFLSLDYKNIADVLMEEKEFSREFYIDKYKFFTSGGFDIFSCRYFKISDELKFIWRLYGDYKLSEDPDYGHEYKYGTVDFGCFLKVFNDFCLELKNTIPEWYKKVST